MKPTHYGAYFNGLDFAHYFPFEVAVRAGIEHLSVGPSHKHGYKVTNKRANYTILNVNLFKIFKNDGKGHPLTSNLSVWVLSILINFLDNFFEAKRILRSATTTPIPPFLLDTMKMPMVRRKSKNITLRDNTHL